MRKQFRHSANEARRNAEKAKEEKKKKESVKSLLGETAFVAALKMQEVLTEVDMVPIWRMLA